MKPLNNMITKYNPVGKTTDIGWWSTPLSLTQIHEQLNVFGFLLMVLQFGWPILG